MNKQYSCNHCIQYTSKENSVWCITQCSIRCKTVFLQSLHTILQKHLHANLIGFDSSKDIPTWRKWYSAFATSKLNSFWFIREGPNKWVTVFLKSMHKILQTKIRFDSSRNVPTWRIHYSFNLCIQYLKRKFVLMHHTMFQHAENSTILAIIAYNISK